MENVVPRPGDLADLFLIRAAAERICPSGLPAGDDGSVHRLTLLLLSMLPQRPSAVQLLFEAVTPVGPAKRIHMMSF